MKDGKHRIMLPDHHYDLVRRYMVVFRLPSARSAVLRMIEVAIDATGKEQLLIEELEKIEAAPTKSRDRVIA